MNKFATFVRASRATISAAAAGALVLASTAAQAALDVAVIGEQKADLVSAAVAVLGVVVVVWGAWMVIKKFR